MANVVRNSSKSHFTHNMRSCFSASYKGQYVIVLAENIQNLTKSIKRMSINSHFDIIMSKLGQLKLACYPASPGCPSPKLLCAGT